MPRPASPLSMLPQMERCTHTIKPPKEKDKPPIHEVGFGFMRDDHDNYALPSTSNGLVQILSNTKRVKQMNTSKLNLALKNLWAMKMNSLPEESAREKTSEEQLKELEEQLPSLQRTIEKIMTDSKRHKTSPPEKKKKSESVNKIEYEEEEAVVVDALDSRDASDLLETTASGYAAAAPQYVTDFSGMDYPLQQHLQNGTSAYSVYPGDTYSYYQYSGNVHSPNAYIGLQGGQSPNSADDEHNNVQHATRACPATIQWLLDNYEPSDGTSLPRCTLYDHYRKHCSEFKLDPVNAASFGKLIRNVFQNLRTRRLGTRGNSKYHYYGIRIKPDSPLNRQPDPSMDVRAGVKRPNPMPISHSSRRASHSPVNAYSTTTATVPAAVTPSLRYSSANATEADKQSLGTGDVPRHVNFQTSNELDRDLRKLGLDLSHVCKFVESYKINCSEVLDAIKMLSFDQIEDIWTTFWQPDDIEDIDKALSVDRLNQQQLFSLCTLPQIQHYVTTMDISFYQVIVDILVPSVLMSQMTPNLTQMCRSFAKSAESSLKTALKGAPEMLQKKKIQAVKYLSQGLRRYTSLNHLAQAAKAVLLKAEQVQCMFNDYVKIDINHVQEQAGWVCGCDFVVVSQIHNSFRDLLQKTASMNEWAEWMESIVDQNVQVLSNFHGKPLEEVTQAAKSFLQHWSFYTSILIRDLTLRSAASFGSFHLIRILTDEYMQYLVESRLAKAMGRAMIAVVTQPSDYPLFDDSLHTNNPLPSITLDGSRQIYMPNGADTMLYGMSYHHYPMNNNETEINAEGGELL